jgi:hypothetical protein
VNKEILHFPKIIHYCICYQNIILFTSIQYSSNAKRALTFLGDDDHNEPNKADSITTDSKRQKTR